MKNKERNQKNEINKGIFWKYAIFRRYSQIV